MRKYWRMFVNFSQVRFEYRMNLFWRLAGSFIWVPVFYAMWVAIISAGFGADKYTVSSLTTYYISVYFIQFLLMFNQFVMEQDIRRGDLASDLVKPYSYFIKFFLRNFPEKIIFLIAFSLVLFWSGFSKNIPFVLLSTILAIFIRFFIEMAIGSTAFWFKRVFGFNALVFNIGGIFSGSSIPTDLLPQFLAKVGDFLPFQYMTFIPAYFSSHPIELNQAIRIFFIQIFWIILFAFLANFIWNRGIKQFESSGG